MAAGEVPERRRAQRVHRLADVDVDPAVALAGECQDRVRTSVHPTVDATGQVHAQEREAGVRYRVDEAAHQWASGRHQLPILAAERDDPPRDVGAGRRGQQVGLEPTAVHQASGPELAGRRRHALTAGDRGHSGDPTAGPDLPAELDDVSGQLRAHRGEVDDAGLGDVQRADAPEVRLHLHRLGCWHRPDGEAVGPAPFGQRVQAIELLDAGRHDQLPGDLDRNPVVPGVSLHRPTARGAEQRLEGPGWVVDPGVDHPAVAAALVKRGGGLLLQHHDRRAGAVEEQCSRRRQTHDPATDDDRVQCRAHGVPIGPQSAGVSERRWSGWRSSRWTRTVTINAATAPAATMPSSTRRNTSRPLVVTMARNTAVATPHGQPV